MMKPPFARARLSRGYTLVELVVAIGLFAVIMTLATGAYLIMISVNRQAQSIATGIDNLSFALEDMTRTIRTGTGYQCGAGTDCPSGGASVTVVNQDGASVTYDLSGSSVRKTVNGEESILTEPTVQVSTLQFFVTGTRNARFGDYSQPYVTMIVGGTVTSGPGKTEPFHVETGAAMRGTDL
jgi:prepilin-type N-terminal cleavage/methylation domain-containing protein